MYILYICRDVSLMSACVIDVVMCFLCLKVMLMLRFIVLLKLRCFVDVKFLSTRVIDVVMCFLCLNVILMLRFVVLLMLRCILDIEMCCHCRNVLLVLRCIENVEINVL